MAAYYFYLWKITWPEVIATGLIAIFILSRLAWKLRADLKRPQWRRLRVFCRVGFWLSILGGYLLMFGMTHPDWLARPEEIQGEVSGKTLTDSSQNPYSIQIKAGTELRMLGVDFRTYKTLNIGDRVKIKEVPNRLEVYQCEVLP